MYNIKVLTNFYKKRFPQFFFAKKVCTSLLKIIKTTKLPYLTILEQFFFLFQYFLIAYRISVEGKIDKKETEVAQYCW